jgi:hypothetical protein
VIVQELVLQLPDAAVRAFVRRMERLADELPSAERQALCEVLRRAGLPSPPSELAQEEDDYIWWAGDVGY